MTYIKVFLLIAACFTMRPSALGQTYSIVSISITLLTIFLHLIEHSLKREMKPFTPKSTNVFVTVCIFWMYSLVQATFNTSAHMDFVIKGAATNLIIIGCFALILSEEKINKMFFKSFFSIQIFFIMSYLISLLLSFFSSWDYLYLFQIPIQGLGYDGSGKVYFPLTPLYSFMNSTGIQLPRLLGFYREAGIFQAFLIWSFFSLKSYGMDKRRNKLLIILGLVATFSTAGIGVFIATLVVKMFLSNRSSVRFFGFLILPISYFAVYYTPYIGLNAKSEVYGGSLSDRIQSMTDSLSMLKYHPFGVGMFNSTLETNSGINLIAASYMIGIFGVILVILALFLPMLKAGDRRGYFVAIFPIFLTMLFSQPILDAPLVYVALLANYNEFVKKEKRVKETKLKNEEYNIPQSATKSLNT